MRQLSAEFLTNVEAFFTVGLAFKEQVVEPGTIPVEGHDKFVQGVVSPAFPDCLHRVARSDDVCNNAVC